MKQKRWNPKVLESKFVAAKNLFFVITKETFFSVIARSGSDEAIYKMQVDCRARAMLSLAMTNKDKQSEFLQ